MRLLFFSILTILIAFACKPEKNQNTGKQTLNCYIRVLETENRVRAEASMSSMGTLKDTSTHPVEVPNGILYQGVPMTLIPNQGLTYVKDFPGKFMPEHRFTWQDTDGQGNTFSVQMNPVKNLTFGTKTLSNSKPATCTWEPNGLERGEALVFMWENAKAHRTVPMELYIQGNNPKIEFPAAKLKELEPGTWTLYVVRKKLSKAQIGPVFAQCVSEFYSATDTITVTQ